MNPIITGLLIFGGSVQVIADLIVIDKAFGISARAKYAWLVKRDRRRSRAFTASLIQKGREYSERCGINYDELLQLQEKANG